MLHGFDIISLEDIWSFPVGLGNREEIKLASPKSLPLRVLVLEIKTKLNFGEKEHGALLS